MSYVRNREDDRNTLASFFLEEISDHCKSKNIPRINQTQAAVVKEVFSIISKNKNPSLNDFQQIFTSTISQRFQFSENLSQAVLDVAAQLLDSRKKSKNATEEPASSSTTTTNTSPSTPPSSNDKKHLVETTLDEMRALALSAGIDINKEEWKDFFKEREELLLSETEQWIHIDLEDFTDYIQEGLAEAASGNQIDVPAKPNSIVYALEKNALVIWNTEINKAVLAMKDPDGVNIIKLRDIDVVQKLSANESISEWVGFGTPPALYLNKKDIESQIYSQMKDSKSAFGQNHLIAFHNLVFQDLILPPQRIAVDGSYKISAQLLNGKLTATDMGVNPEGDVLGTGRCKCVTAMGDDTVRATLREKTFLPDQLPAMRQNMRQEVDFSRILIENHVRHILPLERAVRHNREKVGIVMPWIDYTLSALTSDPTLFALTPEEHKQQISDQIRFLEIILQVAETLVDLKKVGCGFTDLKTENVLVDRNFKVFFSDLGSIAKIGETAVGVTFPSPEQISQNKTVATPEHDAWSLGVLMLEVFKGRSSIRPFVIPRDALSLAFFQETVTCHLKTLCKIKTFQNNDLDNLILELLSMNPAGRPKMDESLLTRIQNLIEEAKKTQ